MPALRAAVSGGAFLLVAVLGGCALDESLLRGDLPPATGTTAPLTADEAARGLREALAVGTERAIASLGRRDGFWDNAQVRIPLPKSLERVADLARRLGQGDAVEAFELSMNRAAERAVPAAAGIFADAVRGMSLQDAFGILAGGDHAATDYFRRVAGANLRQRLHPLIAEATASVGVTERYKALMTRHGDAVGGLLALLGEDEASLDLDDYVTERALDSLFTRLAQEEAAIRHDPVARTSRLLQRVFGG